MLKINDLRLMKYNHVVMSIENLHIKNGQVCSVMGKNCSGKSLLLKLIHGDYYNYEGEILIKNQLPESCKDSRRLLLIEQSQHLLFKESVWRNIVLPFTKVDNRLKSKINELAEITGIINIFDRKVETLSSSECKFIEIIRAIVQLPYIILIDDIDTFFDEINMDKAMKLFEYAKKGGTTVIASSKRKLPDFDVTFRIQDNRLVTI